MMYLQLKNILTHLCNKNDNNEIKKKYLDNVQKYKEVFVDDNKQLNEIYLERKMWFIYK